MFRLLLCCGLLLLAGCQPELAPPVYDGSVKLIKVNGEVTEVHVVFPGYNAQQMMVLKTPEQVEAMRNQLASMLKDMEYAKEQMRVPENVHPLTPVE